jgi:hypothetical protein
MGEKQNTNIIRKKYLWQQALFRSRHPLPQAEKKIQNQTKYYDVEHFAEHGTRCHRRSRIDASSWQTFSKVSVLNVYSYFFVKKKEGLTWQTRMASEDAVTTGTGSAVE